MTTPDEIATSLVMDEIPVKLRCAACNKLAINAFRMPCCDQSICETCQSTLPQACPVCLHEPVKADDCRPNKALRTTIKVFLRKKVIERDAARKKELSDKVVTTAAVSENPTIAGRKDSSPFQGLKPENAKINGDGAPASGGISNIVESIKDTSIPHTFQVSSAEDQKDIPRPSIESANDEIQKVGSHDTGVEMNGVQERKDISHLETERGQRQEERSNLSASWGINPGAGLLLNNNGIGLDGMSAGFPNMDFGGTGDFGQMMQFMPNGMQTNGMGAFPNMMMMPGMGMDPMTMSQGMYGGLGVQGMGMNGMNVGMGFNAGQGAFGGFNGQPAAWNSGQDKFNQNAYGGHSTGMAGDFGANAGYGGYNMPQHHGNFNQIHHQYQNNDFQNGHNGQGFHNRGRGRGRGYHNAGRGRGGHNQVNAHSQSHYEPFHHQIPQPLAKPDPIPEQATLATEQAQDLREQTTEDAEKASGERIDLSKIANEKLSKELEPGDADDIADANTATPQVDDPVEGSIAPRVEPSVKAATPDKQPKPDSEPRTASMLLPKSTPAPDNQDQPAPIKTFISDDVEEPSSYMVPSRTTTSMPPPTQPIPLGPAAQYTGDHSQDYGSRGRGSGRGYFRGSSEYRGAVRGRGSSFHSNLPIAPTTPIQAAAAEKAVVVPAEPKGLGVEGAPKAPKALREGLPNTGIRGGRGFSIIGRAASGSQARANGHTRSRSPSPGRSRSPSRHTSNRHRNHRHRSISSSNGSDRETRHDRQRRHSRKHGDEEIVRSQGVHASHTRETSPQDPARKSSHRSHREHTKEKDANRSGHRSHRSHRERSRERDGGGRRRSRSAENGAARAKRLEESQLLSPSQSHRKEKPDELSQSLRKRRDRDEEDRHRERKRSRRDRSSEAEEKEGSRRTRHSKRDEIETKAAHDPNSKTQDRSGEKTKSAASKPEMDHHTLEREARNRERLLKELQRREAMEGKGSNGQRRESKADGRGGTSSRRMSYKYEDEESSEARASRVESEREAGRWR